MSDTISQGLGTGGEPRRDGLDPGCDGIRPRTIRFQYRGKPMVTDGATFACWDGMTWPLPGPEQSHEQRYPAERMASGPMLDDAPVTVTRRASLAAATIMDAYESLVWCEPEKRERVVYAIRRAVRACTEASRPTPVASRGQPATGRDAE